MTNKPSKSEIQRTAHLTTRAAATELGIGETTVRKYRNKYAVASTRPGDRGITDGSIEVETTNAATITDAEALLTKRGVDPDKHDITYQFTEGPNGVTWAKAKAVPKREAPESVLPPAEDILAVIDTWDMTPATPEQESSGRTLVVAPSDWQIGKTDFDGGHEEVLERIRNSIALTVEKAKAGNYDHIIVAELGDTVENFYNTSTQSQTNDLDMTTQIRVARRLLAELIRQLAPHAPGFTYVTVPSNHGAVRSGMKNQAAGVLNDWGIEIAHQLADIFADREDSQHIAFVVPNDHYESVSLIDPVTKTNLGFVHGHQVSNVDKLGDWWKGQSHGRMPVGESDILLTGHWHSFRVQHSGDARWIIVAPTSDPGSSWFTNLKGERSQSGMLSFELNGKGSWHNIEIL